MTTRVGACIVKKKVMVKTLTVDQIAELADCDESLVRNAMRRGSLPSQECVVVRQWLEKRWERRVRRIYREEINRG